MYVYGYTSVCMSLCTYNKRLTKKRSSYTVPVGRCRYFQVVGVRKNYQVHFYKGGYVEQNTCMVINKLVTR